MGQAPSGLPVNMVHAFYIHRLIVGFCDQEQIENMWDEISAEHT